MARFFGYNAPYIGGQQNILSRQEDERIIRNDLIQLLLTSPGERVMRPDFGTGIRRFLFENMDRNSLEWLSDDIRDAVGRYERRVRVSDVIIDATNGNTLNIRVYGVFNLDRFAVLPGSADIADADLLVELNIPTTKIGAIN